jgi:hypothetical protein
MVGGLVLLIFALVALVLLIDGLGDEVAVDQMEVDKKSVPYNGKPNPVVVEYDNDDDDDFPYDNPPPYNGDDDIELAPTPPPMLLLLLLGTLPLAPTPTSDTSEDMPPATPSGDNDNGNDGLERPPSTS